MYSVLIVTSRKDAFDRFVRAFEAADKDLSLQWAHTGSDALDVVSKTPPDLMVVDETVGDMDGLTLIRKTLGINAMVNTALVSPLSSHDFHEATEGLGILGGLPVMPEESDARAILSRLVEVVGPK